jgi:hypothetical protein
MVAKRLNQHLTCKRMADLQRRWTREVDGVLRYRRVVSGYRQAASLRTRAGHGAFCGETYVA